ncbi:unnamed protein product [Effrenium voratum]|uniref:Uncharacterized protein n=1 Tax=Effrenium voratum TaxID=2562239 RepID=A0AA36NDK7_9DINO|nr:unnamed protein product [Effrenium voratum]CAJ1402229.1 unnamed protein product [Effrenium voratum]CAJ1434948.1 unnamed protein product [Effrenium voratum]
MAAVAKRPPLTVSLLWRALLRATSSKTVWAMLAGGAMAMLIRYLQDMLRRFQQQEAESLWRRHVDLGVVQACLLTTEHLKSLGRVEKRTLFVKPIAEVFRNEYVLANVLRTAEKAVAKNEPFLVTHMSQEDKWHVLTTCTNHLSSCFAPYHVFFNEARRVESYYQSAWYVFTLTCAQTEASGRWFITPLKPVGKNDVGMLRIRILMMNEQELRDISSGAIEPPSFGFFNGRHESRWTTCQRFAELFGRQLTRVAGTDDVGGAEWGPNLCGRLSNSKKKGSNPLLSSMGSGPPEPEENCILRIHVPFPAGKGGGIEESDSRRLEECVSKDVVLFE